MGYHGVFEHERRNGQEFVVDVRMHLQPGVLEAAAATDRITDAVDYSHVATQVLAAITGEPLNLIETLADRIATSVLADPRISCVYITVHKPQAPLAMVFTDVTVSVCRHQEHR
jgi:dihydroneopterin aldolase